VVASTKSDFQIDLDLGVHRTRCRC